MEKNTILEANIGFLHLNEKNTWNLDNNADKLNLNYWLKKNSNSNTFTFVANKNSIPFSVGKRDCAGQSLAVKELYAFFANLLLKYQIFAPQDGMDVNFEYAWNAVTFLIKPEKPVVVKYR